MKKSIFTLLVVALAAPMMFNSCKGGGGDDPTPTPSDLPVPPKAAQAVKVIINPPSNKPTYDYPASFEYTETGKGIVGFKAVTVPLSAPVKSEDSSVIYYITGTATQIGNVFTLVGPDGKTYKFEVTGSGSQAQIKFINPDGNTLDLTGTLQAVKVTNQFFTNLCRSWSIIKTRVSIVADAVNAAAEWPNEKVSSPCDLNAIEAFASDYYKITDHLPQGMVITSVDISNRGTFNISFANKMEYVGDWGSTFSNGFSYSWKTDDMGFQLEDGKASFEFVTDSNVTYCIMTLSAIIKDGTKSYDTKVFCTMKQK